MSADVPNALLEKIKVREEELRKKEKEMKLREAQVKERGDELESAKQQVDTMLEDLERREADLSATEKKHGALSRREDAAHQRDMQLSDREVQLQDKLAEISRKEKENAAIFRQRAKEYDSRMFALQQQEADIKMREEALREAESEMAQRQQAARERNLEMEAHQTEREKEIKTVSIQQREEWKLIERRQLELEQNFSDLQDRLKFQRAEQMELETRDRDVKWKEDQLREGHAEVTAQKQKLLKWDADLIERQVVVENLEADLQHRKDSLDEDEIKFKVKLQHMIQSEQEIREREKNLDKFESELDDREAVLTQREAIVNEQVRHANEQVRKAEQATEDAQNLKKEMAKKQQLLRDQLHLMKEKERSLKDWMVELEFRSATLRQKEEHPAPYLQQLKAEEDEDAHVSRQFNEAIVSMSLQRLQGTYLGATMKSRTRKTLLQDTKRRTTALKDVKDSTAEVVDQETAAHDVEKELRVVEAHFKDLITGYIALSADERQQLFTQSEEVDLIEAIEFDVELHDESVFLQQLTDSPLPAIDLNLSAGDSKLLGLVTRWINDRKAMITERWRRLCRRKLKRLSAANEIMEGRIRPMAQRRKALEEKFSDGTYGLSSEFKERARTRLPSVVHDDGALLDKIEPEQRDGLYSLRSPGSFGRARGTPPRINTDVEASPGSNLITPSMISFHDGRTPLQGRSGQRLIGTPIGSNSLSRASTPAMGSSRSRQPLSRASTPSMSQRRESQDAFASSLRPLTAEERLVDALPPYLRPHYGVEEDQHHASSPLNRLASRRTLPSLGVRSGMSPTANSQRKESQSSGDSVVAGSTSADPAKLRKILRVVATVVLASMRMRRRHITEKYRNDILGHVVAEKDSEDAKEKRTLDTDVVGVQSLIVGDETLGLRATCPRCHPIVLSMMAFEHHHDPDEHYYPSVIARHMKLMCSAGCREAALKDLRTE